MWVEVIVRMKEVLLLVDRSTVSGAGTGGLMISRPSCLFARRKMPEEEQERERWREEKNQWRSHSWSERESEQTHLSDSEGEREGEMRVR